MAFAQHHVAAALAVHRMRVCANFDRPSRKRRAAASGAGVQLGIAARQPADVAIVRRRLRRAAARTARSPRRRAASHRAHGHRQRKMPRPRRARSAGRAASASRRERYACASRAAQPSPGWHRDRDGAPPPRRNARAAPPDRHARSPERGRDGVPAAPAFRRAGSRRAPAMPSGSSASAISVRCRSLPSLLSTTPPTRTAGLYEAKPAATAAADCDCPDTSRMSSTGRPRRAARSEAAPERPGVPGTPSNSPIAPSITSTSALCVRVGDQRVDQRRRHRPGVEIDALGARRRGMERRDRYNPVRTSQRAPRRPFAAARRAGRA